MWIFGFSPGVCPTELCNLVSSFEYLVSNGRQVLMGGIRLGGSAIAGRTIPLGACPDTPPHLEEFDRSYIREYSEDVVIRR